MNNSSDCEASKNIGRGRSQHRWRPARSDVWKWICPTTPAVMYENDILVVFLQTIDETANKRLGTGNYVIPVEAAEIR